MKTKRNEPDSDPITVTEGSVSVKIYKQTNRVFLHQKDPQTGRLLPVRDPVTGKKILKSEHAQFELVYWSGSRRVKQKFHDLAKAEAEARLAVTKLANGESEALKLTGTDRADYVKAMQRLRHWRPDADLNLAVADYVGTMTRLPDGVSLQDSVRFYLSRHPAGLPRKTTREIVDELLEVKTNAGICEPYARELRLRLGQFAESFAVPLSTVSSKQIQDWLTNRRVAGRTQNNYRRIISTLFKFAIRRGYLPKDNDELSGVEKIRDSGGEIEVFTPPELQKLFAACLTPVQERGKWRTRHHMIPYLAIAAFCGLRAAEIQRLDWSEVHLTGPERFIEVKASKAKTASRRTVPIPDNCAAWLAPYAQASGPVATFDRSDKQLFIYLAGTAGVPWKHNGLRHSFISYRLAIIKNVHQVSLEAGNSPQMVFAHYRQLVRESGAAAWFTISPAKPIGAAEVIPMPPVAAVG